MESIKALHDTTVWQAMMGAVAAPVYGDVFAAPVIVPVSTIQQFRGGVGNGSSALISPGALSF